MARDETKVTYFMAHACSCFATGGNVDVRLFGDMAKAGTSDGFQSADE